MSLSYLLFFLFKKSWFIINGYFSWFIENKSFCSADLLFLQGISYAKLANLPPIIGLCEF